MALSRNHAVARTASGARWHRVAWSTQRYGTRQVMIRYVTTGAVPHGMSELRSSPYAAMRQLECWRARACRVATRQATPQPEGTGYGWPRARPLLFNNDDCEPIYAGPGTRPATPRKTSRTNWVGH